MSESQIYKWFWETKQKSLNVDRQTVEQIVNNPVEKRLNLSNWQKFEVLAKKALK